MTQWERRIWLIDYLKNESSDLSNLGIPGDEQGQKDLLRALMNTREPKPVDDMFLEIQDEYLQEESRNAGIVDVADLTHFGKDSRIILWQGDITTLKCGAIVNSANRKLRGCFVPLHGCIDNCIHTKSGIELRLKCDEIMNKQGHDEPVGSAKITPAYNLPSDYVIHVAGPVVEDTLEDIHLSQLETSYRTCLEIAELYDIKSIAFCCISTGEHNFPHDKAADTAIRTVYDHISGHELPEKIVFNVFKDEDREIYTHLLSKYASRK